MDVKPTWDDIRVKVNGLWPRFEPTDAERALIATRLSSLNMRWLDAAIDEYRCESSSTVFRIAELLDIYKRIANTGERSTARPRQERQAENLLAELERDEAECRAWLESRPRDEIAAVVRELRTAGWISDRQLPPRVSDWPRQAVVVVTARMRP